MADFTKPYDPQKVENEIYKKWLESGYFNPDKLPGERTEKFTIMLPPPNVTGSLHMGHALNATIQDVLIRKNRMAGRKTLWLPGTDHAGIATQNVVEKKLQKEGISRHDLGREKFLEKVWEWKEEYGNKILDQLKKIGASCDWSRTRFTMDDDYKKAVEEAFSKYYNDGLIYQGERVINWCKRCLTSLSDLELEHEEEKGKLYYIKYPVLSEEGKVKREKYVVVATTRPETMLGDTAVAVNPDDERYRDLVDEKLLLPIVGREIPVIADESIDKEFGTGAVKITPNHSLVDSDIADRHKLPRVTIINKYGKMTAEAGKDFENLSTKDAREKVVAKLEELGLLEKTEDYTHRVSKCYRCNSVIEPQSSKQWFLKMDGLAKEAMEAVKSGKIKFNDERWEKIFLDWMSNIRDWCISRQIWWGHRLPVYFCKNKQEEVQSEKSVPTGRQVKVKSEEKFIISDKKPEKCPFCNNCEMEQSEDVLDTWFSSALWPFATLGWPDKDSKDLKEFYPTNVLVTARDIINLWVARMIFSGFKFMNGVEPFKDVIINPTILAKSGQRMSKSLGTGIDPLVLVEKYGADATRFGLIYQMMGNQDIKFDESHLLAGKKFANKLWNISRFVLENTDGKEWEIESHDTFHPNPNSESILSELGIIKKSKVDKERVDEFNKRYSQDVLNDAFKVKDFKLRSPESLNKIVDGDIDHYLFGPALHVIYDFIWHDFADKYIEEAKKVINDESKSEAEKNEYKKVLYLALKEILKLLHPFMPFITEEIWSELPMKDKELLIISSWPR